jgi:hypothetical protein
MKVCHIKAGWLDKVREFYCAFRNALPDQGRREDSLKEKKA